MHSLGLCLDVEFISLNERDEGGTQMSLVVLLFELGVLKFEFAAWLLVTEVEKREDIT